MPGATLYPSLKVNQSIREVAKTTFDLQQRYLPVLLEQREATVPEHPRHTKPSNLQLVQF